MRYQFIVRDCVPDNIREELPEFSITSFPRGCTALCARAVDESDLLSMVARLEHLGLAVTEMRHLPD